MEIWKEIHIKAIYQKCFFVHSNLTYEALLVLVYGVVSVDPNSCVYDLRSLSKTHKMVKFKIQNKKDLQYVLRVGNRDFKVYVIVEHHPQRHVN